MSQFLLTVENLETVPDEAELERVLAGLRSIVTEAWKRSRDPRSVGMAAMIADPGTAEVMSLPVPPTPEGECGCLKCTMERVLDPARMN